MKLTIERAIWVLIIASLLFFLFKSCNKKNDTGKTIVKTEIKVDTVKGKNTISYKPKPYAVHDTTLVEIPQTDYTPAEKDYYQPDKKSVISYYRDSLFFGDTVGYAIVKDTVSGVILKRGFDFTIFKKITNTTIEKEILPKIKNKFYLGTEFYTPIEKLALGNSYLGAAILFQNKKDNIIKLSAGLQGRVIQGGISYFKKIKLK